MAFVGLSQEDTDNGKNRCTKSGTACRIFSKRVISLLRSISKNQDGQPAALWVRGAFGLPVSTCTRWGFGVSKRGAAFGAACKHINRADTLLERVFLRCVAFGAKLLARPTPRPAPTRKPDRHRLAKVWKPARNGHQTQHNEEKPVEQDCSAILLQHGAEKRAKRARSPANRSCLRTMLACGTHPLASCIRLRAASACVRHHQRSASARKNAVRCRLHVLRYPLDGSSGSDEPSGWRAPSD